MAQSNFENLSGIGCLFEKTTTQPFGDGANAYDSIVCNPHFEISVNAETNTETTQKSGCDGLNRETDRRRSVRYNADLNLQDCVQDIFGLGMQLGQVPKLEATSRFEHLETLAVDLATGQVSAPWITAADTLYVYVQCGCPGPRRVVAGAPNAGEAQVVDGQITLHSSDLVGSDGVTPLTAQSIHTVRIVTGTNVRYIGADAQRLSTVEIWGIFFDSNGQRMPFWIPEANILNEPSIPSVGSSTATMVKNVSLSTPTGWNFPYKIWENKDTWTFDV